MKLLRLKITDPKGFRSLQAGFEHYFRSPWELQDEQGFAPFVCAGPNGSGKSNLLEALAAIFYQLEILRVRRSFLPDNFLFDEIENPKGFKDGDGVPNAFEIEYLIRVPAEIRKADSPPFAHVRISKLLGISPEITWENQSEFAFDKLGTVSEREREFLLPQYVLGYSSGGNEILSLPFFKMRFIQFDEYWNALIKQLPYAGRPEARLAYIDTSFSQAVLLCNLLFMDEETLKPFRDDVGIEELKEFRIVIKRSFPVSTNYAIELGDTAPLFQDEEREIRLNVMHWLEANERSADNFDPVVTRLKRCATCYFVDKKTDTLYLDYYVNGVTKKAFKENFDQSPIALFQALQVLLNLNLFTVSDQLKRDLYGSESLYVGETVPTPASDERIMRIKHFWLKKMGVDEPILLKSLSDGEHQLLHSLGLSLLFRNSNSLFLLDEPETHFNPDWRANFATRLHECFEDTDDNQEMLITTHTPFLISDSRPEKVLVFKKKGSQVTITKPDYNTLGASINKITMNTFGKRETIGGRAHSLLEDMRKQFEQGAEKEKLISEINRTLGDSVEKVLLIKTILDSMEAPD